MGERQLWDRMEGESTKWFSRFSRFRLMGWRRSVAAIYHGEKAQKSPEKPRGNPGKEWYKAAEQWQWKERAEAWDEEQKKERDRLIALEEEEILKSKYALKHNRIQALNELTEHLVEEAQVKKNMYIYSAKETKFNDGLYGTIDKYLASIAAEKGERVKLTKSELTGKDGGPIETSGIAVYLPQKDEEK